jgi:hypothetical protein
MGMSYENPFMINYMFYYLSSYQISHASPQIKSFSLTDWKVKKILHSAILLFYIQHKCYSIKLLTFF